MSLNLLLLFPLVNVPKLTYCGNDNENYKSTHAHLFIKDTSNILSSLSKDRNTILIV